MRAREREQKRRERERNKERAERDKIEWRTKQSAAAEQQQPRSGRIATTKKQATSSSSQEKEAERGSRQALVLYKTFYVVLDNPRSWLFILEELQSSSCNLLFKLPTYYFKMHLMYTLDESGKRQYTLKVLQYIVR